VKPAGSRDEDVAVDHEEVGAPTEDDDGSGTPAFPVIRTSKLMVPPRIDVRYGLVVEQRDRRAERVWPGESSSGPPSTSVAKTPKDTE
jgi:hypothetical protein